MLKTYCERRCFRVSSPLYFKVHPKFQTLLEIPHFKPTFQFVAFMNFYPHAKKIRLYAVIRSFRRIIKKTVMHQKFTSK